MTKNPCLSRHGFFLFGKGREKGLKIRKFVKNAKALIYSTLPYKAQK